MTKNIEAKLGFDKIKTLLSELSLSGMGRRHVEKMKFSTDYESIKKELSLVNDFVNINQKKVNAPLSHYYDIYQLLKTTAIEGAFLQPEELIQVLLTLLTANSWQVFFSKPDNKEFTYLHALFQDMVLPKSLANNIQKIITDEGVIKDSASNELYKIRQKLHEERAYLRKKTDQLLRKAKENGYTPDDLSPTIRDGRLVIPVLAENKRKISGIVHDMSGKDRLAYIEPIEIFETNNLIRELEQDENSEIIRILIEITTSIRLYLPDLYTVHYFLGKIDFIYAKSKLAERLNATLPIISQKPCLRLLKARHPLLALYHAQNGKKVVPLNIELNDQQRIIVISGPNAGGKSVAVKTIGLLQYMFQCGLLIPASGDSTLGIFNQIFVDMGDEQSIENDLSTYSSHLSNMKDVILKARTGSLILFDEFGTGTDPQFGGAIAEAVLENLNEKKVMGVVNTHYSNLKYLAENTFGLINAAMRYDHHQLEPLFELEVGKPGSSFALEIAQKIGLPKEIIEKASQKLGTKKVNYEKLINELEAEKIQFQRKSEEMKIAKINLDKTVKEYQELKEFVDANKTKMINEAKLQAKQLVKNANSEIENAIRLIKESNAEKEGTLMVRGELKKLENSFTPEKINIAKLEDKKVEQPLGPIKIGDYVKIKGQETIAEVANIQGKDIEIISGSLKTRIKIDRLEKVSNKDFRKQERATVAHKTGVDYLGKSQAFTQTIDVRGKRTEEAIMIVERMLDDAILLNQNDFTIVHGKGDGILRTMIRDFLKKNRAVKSLKDEHADRGGSGITLVELK